MRSLILGSLAIGLTTALFIGCGDDSGSGGSGGDATTSTTTTSGQPTTTSTTKSGSTSTGMNLQCTEVTAPEFQRLLSPTDPGFFFRSPVMLGGADEDALNVEFYGAPLPTGSIDVALAPNDNYATCTTCVLAAQDITMDSVAKYFFQSAGTIDLGTTSPPAATGSIDVTLIEVTIDPETYTTTPVDGGECLHVTGDLAFPEPPGAWTCDALLYGDNEFCDCSDCGVADVDCTDPMLPIFECLDGQTCNTTSFTCEGVPTDWTCPDDQYAGGAGNGCDCNCGVPDPDCTLMGEAVDGCMANEACSDSGTCYPSAWTCDPGYYDSGLMDDCDCGCGVLDPDCADAMSSSCDYCNDVGSCAEMAMDCSTINMTNNAVCN